MPTQSMRPSLESWTPSFPPLSQGNHPPSSTPAVQIPTASVNFHRTSNAFWGRSWTCLSAQALHSVNVSCFRFLRWATSLKAEVHREQWVNGKFCNLIKLPSWRQSWAVPFTRTCPIWLKKPENFCKPISYPAWLAFIRTEARLMCHNQIIHLLTNLETFEAHTAGDEYS